MTTSITVKHDGPHQYPIRILTMEPSAAQGGSPVVRSFRDIQIGEHWTGAVYDGCYYVVQEQR